LDYPNKDKETYIIAVCSNSQEIELNNSILIDSQNTFMKKLKEENGSNTAKKSKKLLSFNIGKKKKIVISNEYNV
jgi:hypothetical protein